jgi:hypothetical protein
MWRGAIYSLEPAILAAASAQVSVNPITVTSPPTQAYLIWTAAWIIAVLAAAIAAFNRRDI